MRLQTDDLINYCKCMDFKSSGKFTILPSKNDNGYWRLELKNKETGDLETLVGLLNTREAYEYLRAFYRGLEYGKILEFNQ